MRPTGPLPPKVYWTRRVALVVIVVLLTSFVWWLVSGSGQAGETKADDATKGAPTSSAPTTPSGTETTTDITEPRSHTPRTPKGTADGSSPRVPTKPTRTPLAQPTGDCKPKDVGMKIDVGDSAPGEANTATLLLTSLGTPACTLSITPETMVVRVTSGQDVVWSSDDCPDTLRARQVVAREDPPAAYQFQWSGQRSSENCQPVDSIPEPGGYWVEAAMIGGEPHKAYFDIKAPRS